ncbi:hypothetical protein CC1G_10599 [Coprinopsis cinerea okayama7|uniref:Uncharacterized protein n=1 Tax=Coprinopsis cinerea (strain Okayama-7 / 130 / ATCC MYA-4618 / FGSC 9003) TaxID=240176 RepID=A8P8N6_COPC7|nr:hypothetical protein CC1G_10599 [Coprinopsis cinerea okayama7\|eukprot:XP_001839606.1 hypothetical protein CC1G_10599 [Coprinopsis cinerea okayama7\
MVQISTSTLAVAALAAGAALPALAAPIGDSSFVEENAARSMDIEGLEARGLLLPGGPRRPIGWKGVMPPRSLDGSDNLETRGLLIPGGPRRPIGWKGVMPPRSLGMDDLEARGLIMPGQIVPPGWAGAPSVGLLSSGTRKRPRSLDADDLEVRMLPLPGQSLFRRPRGANPLLVYKGVRPRSFENEDLEARLMPNPRLPNLGMPSNRFIYKGVGVRPRSFDIDELEARSIDELD